MNQRERREVVKTLLQSGQLCPKEISKNTGISLATVYNIKGRLETGIPLSHQKGAGRPNTLRSAIKHSVIHQVRCKPNYLCEHLRVVSLTRHLTRHYGEF